MFFYPVTNISIVHISAWNFSVTMCMKGWLAVVTLTSYIERMVVRAISLDVRPIACSCKKSYDKVITRAILSHPSTTLTCSRAPATYWRKTVRKILCVCFVQRSLSDASDRACSVRPYFYLRPFLRMHSDQTEFCVSYDFLIASCRAPSVKAP